MTTVSIAIAVTLAVALAWPVATNGGTGGDPEDDLRAVAVLSFVRNSQWPSANGEAFSVGVIGRMAFERALTRVLEGKSAGNRPIRVIEVKGGNEARCQLLYFATDNSAEIKTALANTQALTIGETGRFLDYGGAINLSITDGHIEFEFDLAAVTRSGITISPSLMRLGQLRNGGKGKRQ